MFLEEVDFDNLPEEIEYSENECPVYCGASMTLVLAQQLIFK